MGALTQCDACSHENPYSARFCNECGVKLKPKNGNSTPTSTAERRLLTVLFCDLVDSTVIAENLDPEETRAIIRRFQALSKTIIDSLGGRITEYLGDGIVAQFSRHESNAERAVNAALRIIRELEVENITLGDTGAKAAVRCGIATGMAIVGDMLGDDHIQSEAAVGLPLNLAARLQSIAQVGEVFVGQTTHERTEGLFKVEFRGEHALKGISALQPAWNVVAEQSISSRFVAHAAELTPMVDRTEIMGELTDVWENVKKNKGCAIYCTGEAGIGKSRIVTELSAKIRKDQHFRLEYQCAPYHTNTAFYPLISGLEAEAGFEHKDDSTKRIRKLSTLVKALERVSTSYHGDMPTYCDLLSLVEKKQTISISISIDPDEKKEKIFSSLVDTMISLAKTQPVFMKIEDIHWIDPTTMELVERMIDALAHYPILLLLTSRPGLTPEFVNRPQVKSFYVERLPEKYIHELVNQVQGKKQLPIDVINQIIKRTEGIPLFIEELSKNILESDKDCLNATTLSVRQKERSIPATLQESLTARLDRLPEETRAIAHLAAVIGRDFEFDLLELVAKYKNKNLYRVLTPLLEAQLVIQRQAPPNAKFSFKHALVRDAAYETLLRSDRTTIHKRIVSIMEQHYPDICDSTPGLLARHAADGNDSEKAAEYWLQAGKQASVKYALLEARSHFTDAETALNLVPVSTETQTLLLNVLVSLGPVLMALEGSGSKITKDNYQKAVALCQELPDLINHIKAPSIRKEEGREASLILPFYDDINSVEIKASNSNLEFMALWGQWLVSKDDEEDHGLYWATILEQLSNDSGDAGLRMQAQHCLWATQFHLGDFNTAHKHIQSGIELYDAKVHSSHASEFGGHDPKVCGCGFLSHVEWFQGNDASAIKYGAECYDWALELQHKGSTLHAIELNLLLQLYRRDPSEIETWYERMSKICADMDLPEYAGMLKHSEGLVATFRGDIDIGITMMKEGFNQISSVGTTEDLALYGEITADALLKANRHEEGLKVIEDTLRMLDTQKVQYWRAEVFRCKGGLLNLLGRHSEALISLQTALKIAEEQEALALQLRAAISLFEFNTETGLHPKAGDLLHSIYNSFAETSISSDQNSAKRLLRL